MFEDNLDYKRYIKCISQVLLINFNFNKKDIIKLCEKSVELYNTNLHDYILKYDNLHK